MNKWSKDSSAASLYGKGVFTTIRIINAEPWLWEKHWRRLSENASRIGIDLGSFSEAGTKSALADVLEHEGTANARARVTFYDQRPGDVWPADSAAEPTRLSIIVGEQRTAPRAFKCLVSPHTINSRSPLAGVKSSNYLENILALEDAKQRSCSEAIRPNERGHVAGACMANVFWLKGDRLFTPALSTGCLPGTTREFALENLKCEEVEAAVDEIENADAIFLTSAGLGVVAVDEFNGRELMPRDHPILDLISEKT